MSVRVYDFCQSTKMVSTLNLDEKYNRVRRNFCFYLDVQDHGLARSISRRIQDMGLQQEVFLTPRVSHVIRDHAPPPARLPCLRREGRARADAMLERVRQQDQTQTQQHNKFIQLTVPKAINLLDKLYDTFFTASRKAHVRLFTKHFIKIEFLDKLCRPVYKEFDEWPEISLEPDPPREKKEKKDSPEEINQLNVNQNCNIITEQKMTRKSRPRIKEKEEKETKGGYCEMCNADYVDAALHRRSPHHLAFVRDHTNFLALDSLISSGADVTTFLDKATPINGERRSLRKIYNGDVDQPKMKRSKRSQSPDSTVNGSESPKRNGDLDERKHNTRCSRRTEQEDKHYYKVVSTKLRSSGGFQTKHKDSPPTCNGAKPLVVKFRKVRRSELSVLSDEAEQFMFPKRASSTSSTSTEEEVYEKVIPKRKTPPQPTLLTERRRLARPLALKEESSEEDSWPEDKRRRKRRGGAVPKRGRRVSCKIPVAPTPVQESVALEVPPPIPEPLPIEPEVSPLRETSVEKCMKWEDGRLKYTPAVEQLEFAFESVPQSEPWFETFKRQDQDKVLTKNVPQYFALYSKSPKLPYEIGQLPPLKLNCCPLSDLVKREEKPGPSRSYGTRGMKKQRIRKRTAAVIALESHPRKSPREHASTLAILGSAGLLNRRKHDDAKSTASEDTISDIHSNLKIEPLVSETQEASERLQQFLSEVFEDAADYEMPDDAMDNVAAITTLSNVPDVSSLVSEFEDCDIIRNEIKQAASRPRGRKGKFKRINKTGWPNKKRQIKESSVETEQESLDRSSAEPTEDTTLDTISEDTLSETDKEQTLTALSEKSEFHDTLVREDSQDKCDSMDEDKPLKEQKKNLSSEEKEIKKKKRALHDLEWLQPVVRVARVDSSSVRRLRSSGRARDSRFR